MRSVFVAAAASLVALVAAAPVSADPPAQTEEPVIAVFTDLENGLTGFWNTTRQDYCTWRAGGFTGPPPVIEPVLVTMQETGSASVVASYTATRPIELWQLDSDVPPLGDPCSDTDERSTPWATGAVHVRYTDNDFFGSMSRMNAFGDMGQGTVVDADGAAWHYSWTFRLQLRQDGDLKVVVDRSNLKKKGR